ncbi:MAG: hypothetical protein WC718_16005 [Phycisphaerales bacterium]|jgi:hypothetical protein
MRYTVRFGGAPFLVDLNVDNDSSRAARASLNRGMYDALHQYLASATTPNARLFAIESLADWPGDAPRLKAWFDAEPNGPALSAWAIQRIKWAWEARGGGYANSVGDVAAQTFFQRLNTAKELLVRAVNQSKADATVLPWVIWLSRAKGDSAMGTSAFDAGVKRVPALRALYSSMLLSHSSKWGGSDEEMFQFARHWTSQGASAVLLIEAHYLACEQLELFSDARKGYWLRPDVLSDVLEADQSCQAECQMGMNGIYVRNWLAYALWKCAQPAKAKPHFQAIGKGANERPWRPVRRGFNWLFSPWSKARKQALRA